MNRVLQQNKSSQIQGYHRQGRVMYPQGTRVGDHSLEFVTMKPKQPQYLLPYYLPKELAEGDLRKVLLHVINHVLLREKFLTLCLIHIINLAYYELRVTKDIQLIYSPFSYDLHPIDQCLIFCNIISARRQNILCFRQ